MLDFNGFNFGLRIKELCEERKIPISDFYRLTNTPTQRFYDWCKGSMPNLLTALNICDFFQISVEQFVFKDSVSPLDKHVAELHHKLSQIRQLVS